MTFLIVECTIFAPKKRDFVGRITVLPWRSINNQASFHVGMDLQAFRMHTTVSVFLEKVQSSLYLMMKEKT